MDLLFARLEQDMRREFGDEQRAPVGEGERAVAADRGRLRDASPVDQLFATFEGQEL